MRYIEFIKKHNVPEEIINVIKDKIVSGFIDVEAMELGDHWIDYSWCIWSLEYNLKSIEYTKDLLKELDVEFN